MIVYQLFCVGLACVCRGFVCVVRVLGRVWGWILVDRAGLKGGRGGLKIWRRGICDVLVGARKVLYKRGLYV